jgi:Family of unknown function (DUF5947)
MSADANNGAGRERLAAGGRARGRADLVGGLRGLARRSMSGSPGAGRISGPGAEPGAVERCELCGSPLPPDHRHLLHLDERRMLCACETCWSVRSGEASYRPAGVRLVWLDDFVLPDEAWAGFRVPIGLAFFMRTGDPGRVVAFYPSPAGATESEIDAAAWARLEALNPPLAGLETDCEALIINRISDPHQHLIAPIDECYRLVGLIKTEWEGISGGRGPADAIERFFVELRVRAAAAVGGADA